MIKRFFLFLCLNFSAIGIGGLFTKKGVNSDWYQHLDKAPWTPPGWMFGVAWTLIMICFAFYMAHITAKHIKPKFIIGLFVVQWILNTSWNPIFFHFQNTILGLMNIVSLTFIVGLLLIQNHHNLKLKSIWILPYFLWLLIATSLNTYIVLQN